MESTARLARALPGFECLAFVGPFVARAQDRTFDQTVAPLFIERCIDCHSGAKPKGKLDLTKKAAAFKGGKNGAGIVAKNLEQSGV